MSDEGPSRSAELGVAARAAGVIPAPADRVFALASLLGEYE
jgi:hypothetical protein